MGKTRPMTGFSPDLWWIISSIRSMVFPRDNLEKPIALKLSSLNSKRPENNPSSNVGKLVQSR